MIILQNPRYDLIFLAFSFVETISSEKWTHTDNLGDLTRAASEGEQAQTSGRNQTGEPAPFSTTMVFTENLSNFDS